MPTCIACKGNIDLFCYLPSKFDTARVLKHDETLRYDKCSICNTIQLSPMPTEEQLSSVVVNSYASTQDKLETAINASDTLIFQHEAVLKEIILAGIDNDVLDVGAGTGNLCKLLGDHNIGSIGVEISPQLASYAAQRGLQVRNISAKDIKDNNRFSAITMTHVFEHLTDPEEMLLHFKSILKPGGLLLSIQPTSGMTILLRRLLHANPKANHSLGVAYLNLNYWHTVIFSFQGMQTLANRCGFDLVGIEPMPSLKSRGLVGLARSFYNTLNMLGEIMIPKKWPFHVAHLFILKKRQ